MKEIRIIKSSDKALPILYKEGWSLVSIAEGKFYLDREVKKTRKEKKAEQTPQYIQFKELYPKNTGITSQKIINKIDEIVKAGEFEKLIEGVKQYEKKIFLEKITPKFIVGAERYLNERRWENPIELMENRLIVSEQWIMKYLNELSPKEGERLLKMKSEYKKNISPGVIENMIRKIKGIEI